MLSLAERRSLYAEEVAAVAHLRTPRLVEALATVPREDFLLRGPWQIPFGDPERGGALSYRSTADADPRHVYHNVLVALDPERELNNGHPSSLCAWIDALALGPGAAVFHLGCGTGYYTALMAYVVGPGGHVLGAEADAALAERARRVFAGAGNVEILAGDGSSVDPGPVDAILINAGMTHPLRPWLERLRPGGRLVVPITMEAPGSSVGQGFMLRVIRESAGFGAGFSSPVAIFSSVGGRRPELNAAIRAGLGRGDLLKVRQVRLDAHEPGPTCWLHWPEGCVSTDALGV